MTVLQKSAKEGYVKKAKVKVKGFLLVFKKKKEEVTKPVLVTKRRNQILNLQNVLSAFYNSLTAGSLSVTKSSYTPSIVITTNNGNTKSLSFLTVSKVPSSTGASVLFIAQDNSDCSYTTVSELLVTQIGGIAIDLSTSSLSVTKASDEILVFQWIVTLTVTGISVLEQMDYELFYNINAPCGDTIGCGGGVCSMPLNGCCFDGNININSPPFTSTFITSLLLADVVYNTYSGNSVYSSIMFLIGSTLTIAPAVAPTQSVEASGESPGGAFVSATMFTAVGSPSASTVFELWVEATYSSTSGYSTSYGFNKNGSHWHIQPLYMYAYASTTQDTCWFLGVQLQFST